MIRTPQHRRTRTLAALAAAAVGISLTGAPLPGSASAPPDPGGLAEGATRSSTEGLSGARTSGAGGARAAQAPEGMPRSGRYAFLLRLDVAPTLEVFQAATTQLAGRSLAKEQLGRIRAAQGAVERALPLGTDVLYRTHAVVSGVAVRADVADFAALAGIRGVTAVLPIAPKAPSNAYAVPFQRAPQAWTALGDAGAGSTVAVIDSGVDYTHANFGGSGSVADFEAATAQLGEPVNPGEFPGDKVAGGFDLAGDDYNADPDAEDYNPVPSPDAYPLDCAAASDIGGHGSHVAGTVGGYGVDADGSTYTGAYDDSTPFETMRIGPGMAPEAQIYAYRVFGCAGSTALASQAVDMAADPDGDGDPSDHVDVINLSLGSSYGTNQDADTLVVEEASRLGVTVVASIGNSGDVYEIGGSPGNSPSTIAVAASVDASAVVDTLTVTGPASIAGPYLALRSIAYDWATLPDLAGTVARVSQVSNLDGCSPLSPSDAAAVTGKIAFVEWDANDATRRCGSAGRSANLAAAGATGFVFGSDTELFTSGITGSATIPGVLVAKSGADPIREALIADETVTIGGTTKNGSQQLDESVNDTLTDFSSRGIGVVDNVKPDVAAVGDSVFSTESGSGTGGVSYNGTSMAAPMVAGLAALVRSKHGDWTPEQIKADIMNTATHDVTNGPDGTGDAYAPGRVGSGRIDAEQALANDVLVYNAEDRGTVSVSFGPQAFTDDTELTKDLTVENTGTRALTYALSYSARTTVPGATWSVSPASVTVGPGASETVTVTLSLDHDALTKPIDPTVSREQAEEPRVYRAESSGVVVLEAAGEPELRVPVYAAPRPASAMTQPSTLTLPQGGQQTAELTLSGSGVSQGSGLDAVESLVAGFELASTSEQLPVCGGPVTAQCIPFDEARSVDVRSVGVTSDAPQVRALGGDPAVDGTTSFAVQVDGPWRTPVAGVVSLYVDIDTDQDGDIDFYVTNDRLVSGTDDTDVQVAVTRENTNDEVVDIQPLNGALGDTDTALLNSSVVVLPVANAALGLDPADSRLSYGIATESYNVPGGLGDLVGYTSDGAPGLSFDPLGPGLAAYGAVTAGSSTLLFSDQPGSVLQIERDAAAYAADGGQGLMLVHFHNQEDGKVQTVELSVNDSASTLALDPATVPVGASSRATVTVTGAAGTPTGQVELKDGDTVLGTAPLGANGTARFTVTPTTVGTHPLTATYSGDATYGPSVAVATLAVTAAPPPAKATPATTLTLAKYRVKVGKKVKAYVTAGGPAGTPTGSVELGRVVDGTFRVLDAGNLSGGWVKLTWKPKRKGRYDLVARYSGDGSYQPVNTSEVTVKVRKKAKRNGPKGSGGQSD